ncbi:MAG: hypothetical protein HOK48_08300 [Actinobacteria bacterium]|nr:hypothetical protein [Actinomycetota bacterium]
MAGSTGAFSFLSVFGAVFSFCQCSPRWLSVAHTSKTKARCFLFIGMGAFSKTRPFLELATLLLCTRDAVQECSAVQVQQKFLD